jgi:hypothetical protein
MRAVRRKLVKAVGRVECELWRLDGVRLHGRELSVCRYNLVRNQRKRRETRLVARGGIEPPTYRFSVLGM